MINDEAILKALTPDPGSLQEAAQRMRAAPGLALSFEGYVEADKINRGHVDVVVAEEAEQPHGLLAHGLLAAQERGLLVEGLAGPRD